MPVGAGIAIAGAATGVGAVAQSKASSHAADIEGKSADAALQHEKEVEAQRAAQWNAEQARLAPYRQARLDLFKRWGYIPKDYQAPAQTGPPPGWEPGQATGQPPRRTLGDITGIRGMEPQPIQMGQPQGIPQQGVTLGDLAGFSTLLDRYKEQ